MEVKINTYRIGNTYRDRGETTLKGDHFLSWLNIKGSGMGNTEGIRSFRYIEKHSKLPAYIVLVTNENTSGHQNPWDDIVDYSSGKILYWGDAKAHETRRHNDFKGNKLLEMIFYYQLDGKREFIPPILHFSKPKRGYVKFNGLCALDHLELSWFDDHGKPVRNYRAHLSILDLDDLSVTWLHQRARSGGVSQTNRGAPAVWKSYLKGNLRKLDVWKNDVRSTDDQLPGLSTEENKLLCQLTGLTSTVFEAVVVGIFRGMTQVVHSITRTKATADGGFDFFGTFELPRPLNYRINFLGELKKYFRTTPVGPGDISRVVARLGHGQCAIFVTTSYFTKTAQREVLDDGYPIRLISGIELINMMKELRIISNGKINSEWIANLMEQEFEESSTN